MFRLTTFPVILASQIVIDRFSSLNLGSYSSPEALDAALPLKHLMIHRPDLLLDSAGNDDVGALMAEYGTTDRTLAVEAFLHYRRKLVLTRILASTNDVVIAVLLSGSLAKKLQIALQPSSNL